jgi:hypothetical protein
MKYKFDQFDAEIENPTIEINITSINLNAERLRLSVDVALIVDNATMVVNLDEIPFNFPFDIDTLETKVTQRLTDYEINS